MNIINVKCFIIVSTSLIDFLFMYPNYSPYQPGQQTSGNPNNKPPSSNHAYQPPSFNQGFLSPQGSMNNKNVYASTIQTSTSTTNLKNGFGLGMLEAMGRLIKE